MARIAKLLFVILLVLAASLEDIKSEELKKIGVAEIQLYRVSVEFYGLELDAMPDCLDTADRIAYDFPIIFASPARIPLAEILAAIDGMHFIDGVFSGHQVKKVVVRSKKPLLMAIDSDGIESIRHYSLPGAELSVYGHTEAEMPPGYINSNDPWALELYVPLPMEVSMIDLLEALMGFSLENGSERVVFLGRIPKTAILLPSGEGEGLAMN